MKCRHFERRATDWLGDRLPPEQSRLMASHRDRCPACARLAQEEARLRRDWREADARPTTDVWPRLALRLATHSAQGARVPWSVRRPHFAFTGTLLLVALALFGLGGRPRELSSLRHPGRPGVVAVNPPIASAAPTPGDPKALMMLADVSQTDPAVDDPAGTSAEVVWTHLNRSSPRR